MMEKIAMTIEEEFKELSVLPGDTLVLRPLDAITFVRRCREKRVKVLGLDGFHLAGDSIQPDMAESIDFSLPHYRDKDCWHLAENFLNERLGRSLFFEVVADD